MRLTKTLLLASLGLSLFTTINVDSDNHNNAHDSGNWMTGFVYGGGFKHKLPYAI